MADYPISSVVTLYAAVRDDEGVQIDPSDIVVRIKDPSGSVIEVENTSVAQEDLAKAAEALGETLSSVTGVFQAQVTPDVPGTWDVHWQSTAPSVAMYSWFQVPWPKVPVAGS